MDDYLTKPIDRDRLSEVINRYLSPSAGPAARAESQELKPDCLESSIAPVDWVRLMLTADNDRDFAGELVQLFIESGDSVLQDIRGALERGDMAALGRAAHSLKGSSANMCASLASEAAARLESAARAGVAEDVAKLEMQLRAETLRAMDYLRARQG
jgi:HPt (histidine-containing phosphotransfer) domain-containing protein